MGPHQCDTYPRNKYTMKEYCLMHDPQFKFKQQSHQKICDRALISAKINYWKAQHDVDSNLNSKIVRYLVQMVSKAKPALNMDKHGSLCTHYSCFDFWKDTKRYCQLGHYSYKRILSPEVVQGIETKFQN